ncbi:hypothetical protein QWA68_015182 [Fusarium oxysporum]|nr:hypothetical protein QWA68_015182 [Fusarium oxysporum]
MALLDEENLNQHLHSGTGSATTKTEKLHNGDDSHEPNRWWFLSTAFPMIAGTLGPVASAFSICSLTEPWRQSLVPGGDIQEAVDVADPSWLLIIEGIQLLVGIIANLFLLLNMARRICFGLALPITIVGWYISSICRIALSATAARPFKDKGSSNEVTIWSQSFYYGMFAAILYFADALLLTITFWGAYTRRHRKDLLLTMSQRTLMLQSILLLAKSSRRRKWVAMAISTFLWLLLWLVGAFIFQKAEQAYQGWTYFDVVYFCFEAWTTIGYGDLAPVSNLGRSFYVFWSLLALPTMTILISNAGDTVVRIVRDGIILIGSVTILPNDRGFVRNVKSLVSIITFEKTFGDRGTGHDDAGASSKDIDQQLPTDQPPFAITSSRNIQPYARSTSSFQNNLGNLPTGADLQFLLMSEIRVVIDHLKESKPHHYTFDQWAWYLKLIGEDEHNPRTPCRVDQQKDGHKISEKWSWVGNQSPL